MTWANVAGELTHHINSIVPAAAIVVSGTVKIFCRVNDNVERRRGLKLAIEHTVSSDRAAVIEAYAACLKASHRGREATSVSS